MAGETTDVVNQTTEQDEHQDDSQALADFNAGFEPSSGTVSTATPESDAPADDQQQATQGDTAAATAAAPAQPEFVQLTKQQFDDLMTGAEVAKGTRAQLDKAFGNMGTLQQRLEQLQAQTQAGQQVELTEDDVKELAEEFPELTKPMLNTLKGLAGKLRGTGGPDTGAIDKMVSDRVATTRQELVDSQLDAIVDGDWKAETKTPAFLAWWNQQPADVQALGASESVRDAAAVLRSWTKAKNAPPPPPPAPAAPAPAPISARQRQLAAAVNPRSAGGAPAGKTPEDEFNEGFNS